MRGGQAVNWPDATRRRAPSTVKSIVLFAGGKSTMQQPTHEELQYLELVRDILENGERRPDR
jgi:hypothetical protein